MYTIILILTNLYQVYIYSLKEYLEILLKMENKEKNLEWIGIANIGVKVLENEIIIIIISEYLHRIYTSIYKIAITVCPVYTIKVKYFVGKVVGKQNRDILTEYFEIFEYSCEGKIKW